MTIWAWKQALTVCIFIGFSSARFIIVEIEDGNEQIDGGPKDMVGIDPAHSEPGMNPVENAGFESPEVPTSVLEDIEDGDEGGLGQDQNPDDVVDAALEHVSGLESKFDAIIAADTEQINEHRKEFEAMLFAKRENAKEAKIHHQAVRTKELKLEETKDKVENLEKAKEHVFTKESNLKESMQNSLKVATDHKTKAAKLQTKVTANIVALKEKKNLGHEISEEQKERLKTMKVKAEEEKNIADRALADFKEKTKEYMKAVQAEEKVEEALDRALEEKEKLAKEVVSEKKKEEVSRYMAKAAAKEALEHKRMMEEKMKDKRRDMERAEEVEAKETELKGLKTGTEETLRPVQIKEEPKNASEEADGLIDVSFPNADDGSFGEDSMYSEES